MFEDFKKRCPSVNLVFGDGRDLRFSNNEFDIVFSNAVIEHVGENENQKRFVHELIKAGKRVLEINCLYTDNRESSSLDV